MNFLVKFKTYLWLAITLVIFGFGVWMLTVSNVSLLNRIMTALTCFLISGGFFYFFSLKDFKEMFSKK